MTRKQGPLLLALLACAPAWAQAPYVLQVSNSPYVPLSNPTVLTYLSSAYRPPLDDGKAVLALGFDFPYGNFATSTITVLANGLILMGDAIHCDLGCYLNGWSANSNLTFGIPLVAPLWDDLIGNNSSSRIAYEYGVDSNGGGVLTVEWRDWNVSKASSQLPYHLNFQARLHESGVVEIHYGRLEGLESVMSATIGVGTPLGGTYGKSCSVAAYCTFADLVENELLTFNLPVKPDLAVKKLFLEGVSDVGGGNVGVATTLRVANYGQTAVVDLFYRLYLSTDPIWDALDTPLSAAPLGPFAVGSLGVFTHTTSGTIPAPNPLKTWYLLARLDPGNVVDESNEGNNDLFAAPPFVGGVDVEALEIVAPAHLGSVPVPVTLRLRSRGLTPPPVPADYKIWLSADNILDPADPLLAQGAVPLLGGQTLDPAVSLSMPAGAKRGYYFLILQLDDGPLPGTIPETSETNNVTASKQSFRFGTADLEVQAVNASALGFLATLVGAFFFDDPVRLTATVTNIGEDVATNFIVSFYFSDNETLSASFDPLLGVVQVPTLAPGATLQVSLDSFIPRVSVQGAPFIPANYTFLASASANGNFPETSLANNRGLSSRHFVAEPAPDLVPNSIYGPLEVGSGEEVLVSRAVVNAGNASATAVPYRYFLSANDIISEEDFGLWVLGPSGFAEAGSLTLAPGQVDSAVDTLRVPPSVPPGTYVLGIFVNPPGTSGQPAVRELSLSNNTLGWQQVTVVPGTLAFLASTLPDAIVGEGYLFQFSLTAPSGAPSYQVSSGALPTGLAVSSAGLLSGTAAEAGVFSFVLSATLGAAVTEQRFTLRSAPRSSELAIASEVLPPAVVGVPYEFSLGAQGGVAPYRWTAPGGTLPPGIRLDPSGLLAGSPTSFRSDPFFFTLQVADSQGTVASLPAFLRVLEGTSLHVAARLLPAGKVGVAYTASVTTLAAGGPSSAAVGWTLSRGAVPNGLTLSTRGSALEISGTPTSFGRFFFSLTASLANGESDVADFWLEVYPAEGVLKGVGSREVVAGKDVQVTFALEGGETAVFRLLSGVLPPGVSLSESGELSGTIPANEGPGLFSFVVEARTAGGTRSVLAWSLEVLTPQKAEGCGCSSSAGASSAPVLWGWAALAVALAGRRSRGARASAQTRTSNRRGVAALFFCLGQLGAGCGGCGPTPPKGAQAACACALSRFCLPDGGCGTEDCTVSCPGDTTCVHNACIDDTCLPVVCGPATRCQGGTCEPESCGDVACPPGTACFQDSCVEFACAKVACGPGEACAAGECQPTSCGLATCGPGLFCQEGACVPTTCSGLDCPDGTLCAGRACLPTRCGTETCPAGHVCDEGACVSVLCVGVRCPAGGVCLAGTCATQDCQSRECPTGTYCSGGACLSVSCANIQCAPGYGCGGGRCLSPACGAFPCGPAQLCLEETCVDSLCVGVVCPTGRLCLAGACTSTDDIDGDGVTNLDDNCPSVFNPTQAESDGDGSGDACDCGPSNRWVYPGAPESCSDFLDNDCDGLADCLDENCRASCFPPIPDAGNTDGGEDGGFALWAIEHPISGQVPFHGLWGLDHNSYWAVGDLGKIFQWNGTRWSSQASGTTRDLYAVWGSGVTDVWAVGRRGTALHWNGIDWSPAATGTTANLFAAWGSGPTDIWAAGDGNKIFHWNGGSWSPVSIGRTMELRSMWGTGPSDAWVVGKAGNAAHWNGFVWADRLLAAADLNGIWASSPTDYWVVGNQGVVLHFDGAAWSFVPYPYPEALSAVWGSSGTDLWLSGPWGTLSRWNGTQWAARAVEPTYAAATVTSFAGSNAYDLWTATQGGSLVHWNGIRWSHASGFEVSTLNNVWGSSASDVWAVGESGLLLHRTDGAWAPYSMAVTEHLRGVSGSTVVGNAGTVLSQSMASSYLRRSIPTQENLHAVYTSGLTALAVGAKGTIVRSYDYGNTWILQNSKTQKDLNGLWVKGNQAFAVGQDGTAVFFTGATWFIQPTGTTANLNGVHGTSLSDVWAVGEGGTALHYDGSSWTPESTGVFETLYSVWGPSSTELWAVGAGGRMVRWNGAAWAARPNLTSEDLYAVGGSLFFPDNWWAVGGKGIALRWNGTDWAVMPSGTSEALRSVSVSSPTAAIFAGDKGELIRWAGNLPTPVWIRPTIGVVTALVGLWGSSATDVWAAADLSEVIHWDGIRWNYNSPRTPWTYYGIWGTSSSDVWFAGHNGDVQVWNGSDWDATMSASALTWQTLHALWGSSKTDVWAAGEFDTLLHWNGIDWTPAFVTSVGNFYSLWGSSSSDVWAGGTGGALRHFDGATWSQVPSFALHDLTRLWGSSATDVWGAGGNVVTHFNGTSWESIPTGVSSNMLGVFAASPRDAWAVGEAGAVLRYRP